MELGLDAGAEPSLAGDELVAVADGPDEDRLEHPVLAERVGQGGDLGRVELPAGLERVRVDLVDGDVEQLGRLERAGLEAPLLASRAALPGRVRVVVLFTVDDLHDEFRVGPGAPGPGRSRAAASVGGIIAAAGTAPVAGRSPPALPLQRGLRLRPAARFRPGPPPAFQRFRRSR